MRLFQERGEIDFTDMIYLPAKLNLSLPQYDVVLVDEAQDLSAAQLSVVMGAAGYDAKTGQLPGPHHRRRRPSAGDQGLQWRCQRFL